MSSSIVVLVTRVCGQHANLFWEVFESSHLLGCIREDQLLLEHGSGITGHFELFIQDFDLCSKFGSFLIELMEAGDLPSHPPIIKVFDFALQIHKVATGPKEEGVEPGGERFNGVFFSMPNRVSLCIQIDNVRGLIRALALVITSDSAIFQPFDPLGGTMDSIAEGDVKVGYSPVIFDIAIGGPFKHISIVFNVVMEPLDLFFEAAYFTGFVGFMLCDCREEPVSNGSKDGCIEIGVGRQGGCNCTGRHRWFWTLDWSDQERDAVLGRRGV